MPGRCQLLGLVLSVELSPEMSLRAYGGQEVFWPKGSLIATQGIVTFLNPLSLVLMQVRAQTLLL